MNDIFKLTPEDIAQYREQFSQNNQEEALYALDIIEAMDGDVAKAATMLAPKYNIVVPTTDYAGTTCKYKPTGKTNIFIALAV